MFDAECERLFPRTWMAVAVASDLPGPGDALPVTVAGRNVLLLRDRDGTVRAWYNACRHRGMKLVLAPTTGLGSIACPFHAWTYGLDGRLRGTPYLGGVGRHELAGFDCEELGLIPVRVGEWCNTLFLNLDGRAPPLEEHLAPLVAHLGAQDWGRLHHHRPGSVRAADVAGNWKEYVEVSLEEYHLRFAHPQTFAGIDPLTWKDTPVADRHLFGSEAELSGSYGAGSAYWSGVPLPRWIERGERWQSYVGLFPNLGVWATSDQLSIDFFLPSSAESYDYRQEFYFDPSIEPDGVHAGALAALLAAWRELSVQDAVLMDGLRDNQRTNAAIGNRTRFAGDWEVNLQRFQQQYLRAMRKDGG